MYTPGFLRSLTSSIYDTEFYSRIKEIRFRRTLGFLFLLSLFISLVCFVLLSVYFSKQEHRSEQIMSFYDRSVPEFQMALDKNVLQTIPSKASYFFQFDQNQQLQLTDEQRNLSFFSFQIDTEKTRSEFIGTFQLAGIYVFKDAMVIHTGIQDTILEYASLEIPTGLSFTKATFRAELEKQLPEVISWAKSIVLRVGTLMVFFYSLVTILVLSVFTSLLGMAALFVLQKPFRYAFLIQLAIYSVVPALFIMLVTHLFSISVPFLPFFIYLCFYTYGIRSYHK